MSAELNKRDPLQEYFDGELSEAEVVAIEESLTKEQSEDLRQYQQLGDFVRLASDEWSKDLSPDSMFSNIESGLKQTQSMHPRLQVIEGAKNTRRNVAVAATVFAMAAAAALFFWTQSPSSDGVATHTDDSVESDAPVHVEEDHPVEVHASAGSEVVEVDFGSNTGTVFEVEGSMGQPLAVVWITDEESI